MLETNHTHAWQGFKNGRWNRHSDVREFIQLNYSLYEGDDAFLEGPTEATSKLWDQVMQLSKEERDRGGMWDMDTKVASTITSHDAGYLDKNLETIVGVQTDKPFKRSMQPFGGIRMAKAACEAYGYELDPETEKVFTDYRKTHNQGVFDAYSREMLDCRKAGIITGLPDAYGRGRIIGDYRRVALYGVDFLMEEKLHDFNTMSTEMSEDVIRLREELSEQYRALNELKELGQMYGFDLSRPATNFKEAVQWLYLAYLAAIKEQNGAAMSLGRTSTFLDIYAERDLKNGDITESEVQEIIDHFIMKLRIVKFARTPDYNELFSGDPTWVTESIGGVGIDGRPLVTKNSFRFLHSLDNLGPAPEPNLSNYYPLAIHILLMLKHQSIFLHLKLHHQHQ
ncbi:pyruvate formate lyase family protein, partial [Staphylococcus pasteuri]|uniref:pyruvate formate lyase family protein n=1 Tax=Staphylococcus pasteuri TaxID=45972 RepID=UPI003D03A1A9